MSCQHPPREPQVYHDSMCGVLRFSLRLSLSTSGPRSSCLRVPTHSYAAPRKCESVLYVMYVCMWSEFGGLVLGSERGHHWSLLEGKPSWPGQRRSECGPGSASSCIPSLHVQTEIRTSEPIFLFLASRRSPTVIRKSEPDAGAFPERRLGMQSQTYIQIDNPHICDCTLTTSPVQPNPSRTVGCNSRLPQLRRPTFLRENLLPAIAGCSSGHSYKSYHSRRCTAPLCHAHQAPEPPQTTACVFRAVFFSMGQQTAQCLPKPAIMVFALPTTEGQTTPKSVPLPQVCYEQRKNHLFSTV